MVHLHSVKINGSEKVNEDEHAKINSCQNKLVYSIFELNSNFILLHFFTPLLIDCNLSMPLNFVFKIYEGRCKEMTIFISQSKTYMQTSLVVFHICNRKPGFCMRPLSVSVTQSFSIRHSIIHILQFIPLLT